MIIVLAYHSVGYSKIDKYCITPEMFKKQLVYLQKKFNIIKLSQLETILNQKNNKKYAIITFDDGRQDNYQDAFPILKKLNIPATIFITTGLIGNIIKTTNYKYKTLNLEEIKEMLNSKLINFESHTHNHHILRDLNSTEIEFELKESKKYLENNLDINSKYFVYPKGKFNERVKLMVKKYYNFAFGSTGIIIKRNNLDLYNLPRITLHNKITFLKFKLLLNPIFWIIKNKFRKNDV